MTLAALICGSLALLLSIIAVYGSWLSLTRAETRRLVILEAHSRDLELEVESLRSDYLAVKKSWAKLNSRVAMSIAREKASERADEASGEVPDATKDPAAWRREMMLKYPKGALSHG